MVPETVMHFIGGREMHSSYRKTFGAPDPATGKQYTRVEIGLGADINQAVHAARAAMEAAPWAGLTAGERAGMLARIADGIEARAGQLADFEALGTGLPVAQGRDQVAQAAGCFRRAAATIIADTDQASPAGRPGNTLRRPAGVAGIVTSWRAPFLATARALAPALAAGCAVVVQPDVWAALSAALLPEITTEAGLPAGALNVVHGTGNWREMRDARTDARDALVAHQGVAVVSFAADAAAGEQAARAAAAQGKRLSAQPAGGSPCVILADADLDRAVASTLFGAFALNGGRRTATSRIFAERPVYDAVVARLAGGAGQITVGPPSEPETEVGPLPHAEHYDRVMSYVRRGIRDGARLTAGGRRPASLPEGNYLPATVLADVTPEMQIFTEIISAPVACVTPFDTDEEAATLAGPGAPAAAYLWTADTERARHLALAIAAPVTWVNSHNAGDALTPSGDAGTPPAAGSGDDDPDGVRFYQRSSAIQLAADDGPAPRLR